MMRPGHTNFRMRAGQVKNNKTSNGGPWHWRENNADNSDDEVEDDDENSDLSSLSNSIDDSDTESIAKTSNRSTSGRGLAVETSGKDTEHGNTNTDAPMDPNRPPTPWGKSSAKTRSGVVL